MYEAPSLEVIEMVNEGVIAGSGSNTTQTNEGYSETNLGSVNYGASSSDLEDMINDIFTVEN